MSYSALILLGSDTFLYIPAQKSCWSMESSFWLYELCLLPLGYKLISTRWIHYESRAYFLGRIRREEVEFFFFIIHGDKMNLILVLFCHWRQNLKNILKEYSGMHSWCKCNIHRWERFDQGGRRTAWSSTQQCLGSDGEPWHHSRGPPECWKVLQYFCNKHHHMHNPSFRKVSAPVFDSVYMF